MSKQSLINLKEIFPETVDDFFIPWNDLFRRSNFLSRATIPALNISDEKDHYDVTVAVPGLDKKDFDIELDNDVLTISAISEREREEEKKKYRRKEYSYTSFSRSFTLPADVKTEAIAAKYDNGILSLNLPKNGKTMDTIDKKIEVK